jgi:hypothetical protein
MTSLLVMTVGQTDVQLVIENIRYELHKERCGELHDELDTRGFTIVESPKAKDRDKKLESLPAGNLRVCTPKLDAVLRIFNGSLPTHVLIFDTRREIPSDPRLAGRVVAQRLKERGVPADCCTFLDGTEWLEDRLLADRSNEVDAVVRKDIVRRLFSSISKKMDETEFDHIYIAATGGLPDVNDVVEELTRLHAVGRAQVTSLKVPDGAFADGTDHAIPEPFHPAAGYSARWHALALVEKGNLLGAWGAVSHLKGAPALEWTQVIKWLAQFAASLPFDSPLPPESELRVLNHQRMAVRAALRVELSLRAGDIPRAVHGTVAFFEAALWDRLLDGFDRTGNRKGGLEILRLKEGEQAPTGNKLLRNEEPNEQNKKNCPFELIEDGMYLFFENGAGRFARDYVGSEPLKELSDAIDEVKGLRNDVAHNEPTPDLMNDARTRMQTAALWSNTDTFLSQSLVQNVLCELGESCPKALCTDLFANVRSRLLEVSRLTGSD